MESRMEALASRRVQNNEQVLALNEVAAALPPATAAAANKLRKILLENSVYWSYLQRRQALWAPARSFFPSVNTRAHTVASPFPHEWAASSDSAAAAGVAVNSLPAGSSVLKQRQEQSKSLEPYCASKTCAASSHSPEVPGAFPRVGLLLGHIHTPTLALCSRRGLAQHLLPPLLRREIPSLKLLEYPMGEAVRLFPVYQRWWERQQQVSLHTVHPVHNQPPEEKSSLPALPSSGAAVMCRRKVSGNGSSTNSCANEMSSGASCGTTDDGKEATASLIVSSFQPSSSSSNLAQTSGAVYGAAVGGDRCSVTQLATDAEPATATTDSIAQCSMSSCRERVSPQEQHLPPVCDMYGFAVYLTACGSARPTVTGVSKRSAAAYILPHKRKKYAKKTAALSHGGTFVDAKKGSSGYSTGGTSGCESTISCRLKTGGSKTSGDVNYGGRICPESVAFSPDFRNNTNEQGATDRQRKVTLAVPSAAGRLTITGCGLAKLAVALQAHLVASPCVEVSADIGRSCISHCDSSRTWEREDKIWSRTKARRISVCASTSAAVDAPSPKQQVQEKQQGASTNFTSWTRKREVKAFQISEMFLLDLLTGLCDEFKQRVPCQCALRACCCGQENCFQVSLMPPYVHYPSSFTKFTSNSGITAAPLLELAVGAGLCSKEGLTQGMKLLPPIVPHVLASLQGGFTIELRELASKRIRALIDLLSSNQSFPSCANSSVVPLCALPTPGVVSTNADASSPAYPSFAIGEATAVPEASICPPAAGLFLVAGSPPSAVADDASGGGAGEPEGVATAGSRGIAVDGMGTYAKTMDSTVYSTDAARLYAAAARGTCAVAAHDVIWPCRNPDGAVISGVCVGDLGRGESMIERSALFIASLRYIPNVLPRFLTLSYPQQQQQQHYEQLLHWRSNNVKQELGPLELLHAFCMGADVVESDLVCVHSERALAYAFDPLDLLRRCCCCEEDTIASEAAQTSVSKELTMILDDDCVREGSSISHCESKKVLPNSSLPSRVNRSNNKSSNIDRIDGTFATQREDDAAAARQLLEEAVRLKGSMQFVHLDLLSDKYQDDYRCIVTPVKHDANLMNLHVEADAAISKAGEHKPSLCNSFNGTPCNNDRILCNNSRKTVCREGEADRDQNACNKDKGDEFCDVAFTNRDDSDDCTNRKNCHSSRAKVQEILAVSCGWSTVLESRAYLHHLFKSGEMMGGVLLLQHNLQCLVALCNCFRYFLQHRSLTLLATKFLKHCCFANGSLDNSSTDTGLSH